MRISSCAANVSVKLNVCENSIHGLGSVPEPVHASVSFSGRSVTFGSPKTYSDDSPGGFGDHPKQTTSLSPFLANTGAKAAPSAKDLLKRVSANSVLPLKYCPIGRHVPRIVEPSLLTT